MKLYILIFTAIFLTTTSFAQETVVEDISINGQFETILRISTNYKGYKVINKEKFLQLKQNVLDSIKTSQNLVNQKNRLLKADKQTIKRTQDLLNKTQLELSATVLKEDSISFLSMQLSKVSYNIILWTLILSLISALVYVILIFLKNNIHTKEAKNNLLIVEKELEQHIKNAIDREQKLRRKLQDEVNKQRNS
ncbi:MAG: preprotein translocase subunit SecF [Polaribacter sp.]|jgi:preprotein translocase subunit SecF|tara:strand:- start:1044 stop:1625 length:582 start_codon:yes stop_codon:yes gene_type:complete